MEDALSGYGTDLAPACDRCGNRAEAGFVLDMRTLVVVCITCLTDAERDRIGRGTDPFANDESES